MADNSTGRHKTFYKGHFKLLTSQVNSLYSGNGVFDVLDLKQRALSKQCLSWRVPKGGLYVWILVDIGLKFDLQ